MAYIYYNPNPYKNETSDCVVRAICLITGLSWNEVYARLAVIGFEMKQMPSYNDVWRELLKSLGFQRFWMPETYEDRYTVRDFCEDFPNGDYLLFVGAHVITVIDGDYYDTWDSGDEIPTFFWRHRRYKRI